MKTVGFKMTFIPDLMELAHSSKKRQDVESNTDKCEQFGVLDYTETDNIEQSLTNLL